MKIRNRKVCHTCRARKLGCDGKTPACSQCQTRGYQCAGYQHELIFKTQNFQPAPKEPRRRQPRSRENIGRLDGNAAVTKPCAMEPMKTPDISRALSWTLLDMISLLVQNFCPDGSLDSSSASSLPRICGAWIEVLPQLANSGAHDQVLTSAVKSLSISILAQGASGRAPMCDALRAYGLALSSLRRGLDSETIFSNVFIAASMCLFLSQLMLPTCDKSSMVHAKGVEDLVELSGPESYAYGDSHKLFAGFRPALIVETFILRQPNFVAAEKWNTGPFILTPMNPLQDLMTRGTRIPSILRIIDNLKSAHTPESIYLAENAMSQLIDALVCLDRWRSSEMGAYGYQKVPFDTQGDGVRVWFPNITAANCFTHFWGFWIICIDNIARLTLDFPELAVSGVDIGGQSLDKLMNPDTMMAICGELLQAAEFMLRDEFKLFGAASTVLPVKTACDVLKRQGTRGIEMLMRYGWVFDAIADQGYYFLSSLKADYRSKVA